MTDYEPFGLVPIRTEPVWDDTLLIAIGEALREAWAWRWVQELVWAGKYVVTVSSAWMLLW